MQKILPILINQALYKCPLFLAINASRRCILRQKKTNQNKPNQYTPHFSQALYRFIIFLSFYARWLNLTIFRSQNFPSGRISLLVPFTGRIVEVPHSVCIHSQKSSQVFCSDIHVCTAPLCTVCGGNRTLFVSTPQEAHGAKHSVSGILWDHIPVITRDRFSVHINHVCSTRKLLLHTSFQISLPNNIIAYLYFPQHCEFGAF